MPRERTDLFRKSRTKPKEKIIVLAYEGNLTEADYFEHLKENSRFKDEAIYLYSLRRNAGDTNSAPNYVFNKLKSEAKNEYNFNVSDEFWMIIDRDSWANIPEINNLCKSEGNFYLALSNPCFEFWLLLHLRDTSDFSDHELSEIFTNRKVTSKKTYLKRLLGSILTDGYKESNSKPERFIPHIDDAIQRARKLDNSSEDFPTILGSHVYKLAEKLID